MSIDYFEEMVKSTVKRDWTLVIMANANSDSKAVDFVHRNFHVMDRLANGVNFYLPGYGFVLMYNHLYGDPFHLKAFEFLFSNEFSDSHLNPINAKVINSPRLGTICFNEAEFADFIMEFTRKIPSYEYWGCCQLILLPLDREKRPIYKKAKVFDLDQIINTPGSLSLDSFIHKTFRVIRRTRLRSSLNIIFDKLFFWKESDVVKRITKLYKEATSAIVRDNNYQIIVQNIFIDLEKYLNWSLNESFYFISYSSRNVMKAEFLKQKLEENGLYVWMAPDGIPQGRDYSLVVPTVLRYTKNFVLLLTKESSRSRWVKRELDIAISNDASTTVRVLFAEGYSIDDLKESAELQFYLNKVQIKYTYEEIINDEEKFAGFISY